MKLGIQAVLLVLAAFIAYLIYDSIQSKIELEKEIDYRTEVLVNHMENIKEAQIAVNSFFKE